MVGSIPAEKGLAGAAPRPAHGRLCPSSHPGVVGTAGWLGAGTPHVTPRPGQGDPWGQQSRISQCQPHGRPPWAMPRPLQDGTSHVTGASHVTVLPLRLRSVSTSPYDYEISSPLGRDNYKEMYLFIYR